MSKTKTCSKCKETKLLNEFHNLKQSKDGKRAQCKECRIKEYHNKTPSGKQIKCACGCGTLIYELNKNGIARKYIDGHQRIGSKHSKESKNKMSEVHTGEKHHLFGKQHSNDTKMKISNSLQGHKHSDETKQKISVSNTGKKHTEEHKIKIGNKSRGRIHTPETKRKMSISMKGLKRSEETKAKISKAKKGFKHSEISILNMSKSQKRGAEHHNWKGGISFEPYCPKFNDIFKENIRNKFNRVCFLCGKTELDNKCKLSVHHVQYNKNCGCDDALKCDYVPLCHSCHSKTSNGNRNEWESKIISMLATHHNYL